MQINEEPLVSNNQAPAYLSTNRLNSQTNDGQNKTYLLFFTVFILFYLITVPIIQIGIGTYSLINETCPVEPLISIWLLVYGVGCFVLFSLKLVGNVIVIVKKMKNPLQHEPNIIYCLSCFNYLFVLVWFIFGNVWIYSKWESVKFEPNNREFYCNQLTYVTALSSLILSYVLIVLACVCFCGVASTFLGCVCYGLMKLRK